MGDVSLKLLGVDGLIRDVFLKLLGAELHPLMYLLIPSPFIDRLISAGTETGLGRIKTVKTPSCPCLLDSVLALVPPGHWQVEMLS